MDDDEKTKKAAELLLQGATMLQISCPQCNDPIYRNRDGQMFCVNCQSLIVYERDSKKEENLQQTKIDTNDPIQAKIQKLAIQLDQEQDPDKIVAIAETIKKLQNLK
jgi:UPF0148 protein